MGVLRQLRRWFLYLLVVPACLLALSACSTTGNSFDSSSLWLFVKGQTTINEAVVLLDADPVNIYRQTDGSAIALWAHKSTLATDAVYFNQELWLAFGPDGRFDRIVKSVNIPRAYQYGHRNDT